MAGRVEGQGFGMAFLSHLLGEGLPVPTERYCVDLGTGVYLHCQVFHASLGCQVKLGVDCNLTIGHMLSQQGTSLGTVALGLKAVCIGWCRDYLMLPL